MRLFLIAALIGELTWPLVSGVAAKAEWPSSGSYRIDIDGRRAGSEKFEVSNSGNARIVRSKGEIISLGQQRKVVTATELRDGRVARYEVEIDSAGKPKKYTIELRGGRAEAKIELGGRTSRREFSVHEDMILLDKDVWYHYRYLLERYDKSLGGRQRFYVMIPQSALREVSAEVELKGTTSIESGGVKKRANKFAILIARGFEINAIADESGTPLLIEIPALETKVVIE